MSDNGDPSLLRLPLELRQHIYALIIPARHQANLCFRPNRLDPKNWAMIYRPKSEKVYESGSKEESLFEWRTGILRVSRAISNDVLDFMYGRGSQLMFIDTDFEHFRKIGAANLQRIRFLRIVARSDRIPRRQPIVFDPELWLPLLEGLQRFSIVAKQPLAHRGFYGSSFPTFEEQLSSWTAWLDPILEYFSTHLSKATAVALDADKLAETTTVMDRHFGSGYRKVRTTAGDYVFERGQYSRKHGG